MAQQAGDLVFGIQRALALLDQGGVGFCSEGVAQPVERHTVRVGILNLSSVIADELLQTIHGVIRIHIVWNEQFMAPFCVCQLLPKGDGNGLVDGDSANFAALTLDGDGVFTKGIFCCGGVQPETFVEPQAGVAGQIERQDVIVAILCQGLAQHAVELLLTPGAVHTAEAAALQLYGQLIVGWQGVLGIADFVMEKADCGQVGFDGAGGFAVLLHSEDVGGQMLAADVGKFLQVVLVSQEKAEASHSFIVTPFGLDTALTIMPGKLVQLIKQGLNIACGVGIFLSIWKPIWTQYTRWQYSSVSACFPDDVRKRRVELRTKSLAAQGNA